MWEYFFIILVYHYCNGILNRTVDVCRQLISMFLLCRVCCSGKLYLSYVYLNADGIWSTEIQYRLVGFDEVNLWNIIVFYLTLCTFSFEINESRLSDTRCFI